MTEQIYHRPEAAAIERSVAAAYRSATTTASGKHGGAAGSAIHANGVADLPHGSSLRRLTSGFSLPPASIAEARKTHRITVRAGMGRRDCAVSWRSPRPTRSSSCGSYARLRTSVRPRLPRANSPTRIRPRPGKLPVDLHTRCGFTSCILSPSSEASKSPNRKKP